MTDSYNQTNINLERNTAFKSFIFDSNATGSDDIIFSDWASMLGNISTIPGIKEVIIRAPDISTPATIPAGTWDMTGIRLAGEFPSTGVIVNDAVFENLSYISTLSLFLTANSVPNFQFSSGLNVMAFDQVSFNTAPLTVAPFFEISGSAALAITNSGTIYFADASPTPIFDVQDTAALIFSSLSRVGSGNNYGGGLGEQPFLAVAGTAFASISGFSGSDSFFPDDQAPSIVGVNLADNYYVDNAADWVGAPPVSLKDAIDRIAAALGPIA